MRHLGTVIALCVLAVGLLALPATASAYTFTMQIQATNWPVGEAARASAECVGNYQNAGTKWDNTSVKSHWFYTKLTTHSAVAFDAFYQIRIYSGTTLKWSDNSSYLHPDQWWNHGLNVPAHWTTWYPGVQTTKNDSRAWWYVLGPDGQSEHTRNVNY
jgi:hypothetical protein